jgi:uncharacterized small protein (DUF1192 family)
MSNKNLLSRETRKCLEVHIGEKAANEIYEVINSLSDEIERLKKNKLDKSYMIDSKNS